MSEIIIKSDYKNEPFKDFLINHIEIYLGMYPPNTYERINRQEGEFHITIFRRMDK